jgi:hypothetical protein
MSVVWAPRTPLSIWSAPGIFSRQDPGMCCESAAPAMISSGNAARRGPFEQAMGAVSYYVDSNPAMSQMGRRTFERIMADMSPG